MSKSFKKLSPIAMRKAMYTIECIARVGNDDEKNPVLNDIYRVAHSHAGHCDNPHPDWIKFTDEMAEKLKDY